MFSNMMPHLKNTLKLLECWKVEKLSEILNYSALLDGSTLKTEKTNWHLQQLWFSDLVPQLCKCAFSLWLAKQTGVYKPYLPLGSFQNEKP